MIEIDSQGRWPTNTVADIINARDKLVTELGHEILVVSQFAGYYVPVDVRAVPRICEELNQFITGTNVSYRDFFEKNQIANIIEDNEVEDFMAIVFFDGDEIRVNNVQLRSELGEKNE